MSLRILLLCLLLANLLYAAWSTDALRTLGFGPAPVSEPQRLDRQIAPEALRVLKADEVQQLDAELRGASCLQTGPLPAAALAPLRSQLAAWPAGTWLLDVGSDGQGMLRLPVLDDALRARLPALQPLLGLAALQPCR